MRKFIFIIGLAVLAICLISGGCSYKGEESVKTLQELIKTSSKDYKGDILEKLKQKTEDNELKYEGEKKSQEVEDKDKEYIQVELYFGKEDGSGLVAEMRDIERREGIARLTVGELIKGPDNPKYVKVFPEGSQLLDINVKPNGICIVDLNSEVARVKSAKEEKLMVYALVNTLAQFPTIDKVKIRIEGKETDTIAGYVKWPEFIKPDYDF
ncbi:GerMN domain-containing protein [Thermosyntropha sp.]|uniref:GerMN domain-containing protein n=1 Tax=Thermosyntropha sp. TaxID=2740820 RepID=UPI0025FC8E7F|nr:GerMN domain-containing protein [Thermosyntropha sp.]MBO8159845.1 GerMN domain-containing protein [Thermosyntropha sp.]